MKALRTKVLLSGFVLLFALVASIGSTFAWFTVAQSVDVQAMTLNVTTADSVLIRVANANATVGTPIDTDLLNTNTYATTITTGMFLPGLNYSNFQTWRLQPVTAIQPGYATVSSKTLHTMAITSNPGRSLTANAVRNNADTGHFIELKFWMLSQGTANVNIVLDNLFIDVTDLNNTPAVKDEVLNAVRLGVWGNEAADFVFGRSKDFGFAFLPSLPGYNGTPTVENFNSLANKSALEALMGTYYKSGYVSIATANLVDGGASLPAIEDLVDITTVFTLVPDAPQLVTVRIFIEGWAYATSNNIIDAAFKISFSFKDKSTIAVDL